MRPHFLVIGGQKCGTSWLQDNLGQHPQVWLPPIKEIHFFDRGNVGIHARVFSTSKRMRKARAYAGNQFWAWVSGAPNNLRWALKYWLGNRDDNWYRSLFPENADKISGEICPGYARLPEPVVRSVKNFVPDARIIYLLRNPIERSWSYATQYFTSPRAKGRYGQVTNVPRDVLQSFLERDARGHSNYLNALDAWESHFGDRMLVGFFDQLESAPEMLYQKVVRFIGVDDSPALIPRTVRENRFRSRGTKAPVEYARYLARLHLPALHKLNARLQKQETQRWLEAAESALSGESESKT